MSKLKVQSEQTPPNTKPKKLTPIFDKVRKDILEARERSKAQTIKRAKEYARKLSFND